METDNIQQTIVDFIKAADNSDIELLDKALPDDFRIIKNGFMATSGVK